MVWTLARKEWRQHWVWLILLGIATALLVGVGGLVMMTSGMMAGIFTSACYGMLFAIPLAALILSNRFVHLEYQNKTQLFLEGLPLPRWKMISIKYGLCCFFICGYVVLSILLCWVFSFGSEQVTLKFLAIMLASGFGWALFWMSLFFAIGFLGRYRWVILILITAVAFVVNAKTSVSMSEFPPFTLVDPGTFGLDKETFPLQALKWTGILFLSLTVLSFVIGLAREGSVGSLLGERMSYREAIFVGGTVAVIALNAMELSVPDSQLEPPIPNKAIHEEWEGVNVWVSAKDKKKKNVDLEIGIASDLARRLAEARDWLGMEADLFPKVFVIERNDLEEPEKIEEEILDEYNLLKMYAGYQQEPFSDNRLLSWSMSHILSMYSFNRVGHEDRWWIVCGLEGLWELTEADQKTIDKRIAMAVETVKNEGLTVKNLMEWHQYQEDAEWRNADAVAWMGFRLLKEKKGIDTVQKLARATVVKHVTREDSRPVFWDFANPVESAFEEITGITLDAFVEEWRAEILSHKPTSKAK